jgi:hypothetical protein
MARLWMIGHASPKALSRSSTKTTKVTKDTKAPGMLRRRRPHGFFVVFVSKATVATAPLNDKGPPREEEGLQCHEFVDA